MKEKEFSQLWGQLSPENQQSVARLIKGLLRVTEAEREAMHALVDALPADCLPSARRTIAMFLRKD